MRNDNITLIILILINDLITDQKTRLFVISNYLISFLTQATII